MDIVWILVGIFIYAFIGFVTSSAMDAWDSDSVILLIISWPIILFMLIIFGLMTLAEYIGKKIRKIFSKKFNPCDGCDNSWMTKGFSCDHCRDQSNYYKASEEEIRQYWKDIYKEKEDNNG
jgi:hypothetical protein